MATPTKKLPKSVIALCAPVEITAGTSKGEGEKKGPATFDATFYTGGAMEIQGWDLPIVVDLAGLDRGNVLVANLDHKSNQRVGNFAVENDGKTLVAHGTASAATAARDEVVNSAIDGYQWQASLEVNPRAIEEVKAGKTVEANGQSFTGPLYVTRKGTLKGFAFVSHGADDSTSATIAAIAASQKENGMDPKIKAWAESMGVDVDSATPEAIAVIEANYEGRQPAKPKKTGLKAGIEAQQAEAERIGDITDYALKASEKCQYEFNARERINQINDMAEQAIEGKWNLDKFRLELIESNLSMADDRHIRHGDRERGKITGKVLEAALCMTGRLAGHEKMFDDQTLQLAHDKFRNGIGLKQLFVLAAKSNGLSDASYSGDITLEVQRAAFGMVAPQQMIRAGIGFSSLDIATILSNTANKYLREGWDNVDQTPLRLAAIRNVRNFQEITTVSLILDAEFEKVGNDGEIKHASGSQLTYGNKADTYARLVGITRQDMINDDVGALTAVPRKLGRGAALKLNTIFWTEFLNPSVANFWHANNANVNTGVADMTAGGLAATEAIFLAQTDPNGDPLLSSAKILVVPTALKGAANTLMNSERMLGTSGPDANIWRGRFRVESSPYMSNSAFTGYSAVAYYMIADPNDIPVIEIAALNGRVEPVVETADAEFNVLGVHIRGYSDIGVRAQEPRGGVRADGGAS